MESRHGFFEPSKPYTNTTAKIITLDGECVVFEILAGVLQGDPLAPFLLIIVLDYALSIPALKEHKDLGFTITPRKSRRIGPVIFSDLDFADDIHRTCSPSV